MLLVRPTAITRRACWPSGFLTPMGVATTSADRAPSSTAASPATAWSSSRRPPIPASTSATSRGPQRRRTRPAALVVADNTTMTPYGQRPLDLGVDIVVAADTGAERALRRAVRPCREPRRQRDHGGEGLAQAGRQRSPARSRPGWCIAGWRRWRCASTDMCSSAGTIAAAGGEHPKVQALRFPGLPDDPSHNVARAQMDRFGFLIGLTLEVGARRRKTSSTGAA